MSTLVNGIYPEFYEQGVLQNQDGVISVKASAVPVLQLSDVDMQSHDFY